MCSLFACGFCSYAFFFLSPRRVQTTYFTKLQSDGVVGNAGLPVVLFYVKNSTDFLGRCFTLLPLCITNQRILAIAVAFRFLLVPMFFIYAVADVFVSDLFLLTLGKTMWWVLGVVSKYINMHHSQLLVSFFFLYFFSFCSLCSCGEWIDVGLH